MRCRRTVARPARTPLRPALGANIPALHCGRSRPYGAACTTTAGAGRSLASVATALRGLRHFADPLSCARHAGLCRHAAPMKWANGTSPASRIATYVLLVRMIRGAARATAHGRSRPRPSASSPRCARDLQRAGPSSPIFLALSLADRATRCFPTRDQPARADCADLLDFFRAREPAGRTAPVIRPKRSPISPYVTSRRLQADELGDCRSYASAAISGRCGTPSELSVILARASAAWGVRARSRNAHSAPRHRGMPRSRTRCAHAAMPFGPSYRGRNPSFWRPRVVGRAAQAVGSVCALGHRRRA